MSYQIVEALCTGEFLIQGDDLYIIGKNKLILVPIEFNGESKFSFESVAILQAIPSESDTQI